jgi:hypothetical protein
MGGTCSTQERFDSLFLFVVYLTTLYQLLRKYSDEWKGYKWIINCKGFRRKRSWHDCKVLSRHLPGEYEINHKKTSVRRSPGPHMNSGPPEYEAGVFNTRRRLLWDNKKTYWTQEGRRPFNILLRRRWECNKEMHFNPLKQKYVEIFNNSVRTSKKTPHFTITEINFLTRLKEITVYSENRTKSINTKWELMNWNARDINFSIRP